MSKFAATGGTVISPEMAALFLAIVVNSGSHIAEIVRGAIDALPKGQWDATAPPGLNSRKAASEIMLPHMFRVALPSLGDQYVRLTKNTALGIAIGYPDLFSIVAKQPAHNLDGIVIVIISYLLLS